jgi:hypothetical protein
MIFFIGLINTHCCVLKKKIYFTIYIIDELVGVLRLGTNHIYTPKKYTQKKGQVAGSWKSSGHRAVLPIEYCRTLVWANVNSPKIL